MGVLLIRGITIEGFVMKGLFLFLALAMPFGALAQQQPSVVVFDIKSKAGVGQEIGDTLTEEILARLRAVKDFKVSAMNEVKAALNIEQQKQMLAAIKKNDKVKT